MTVPLRLEDDIELIEGDDTSNVENTKEWRWLNEKEDVWLRLWLCHRLELFDYDQGASEVKRVEQRQELGVKRG